MIDEKMEGEESFAELFEQSLKTPRKEARPGEKLTGKVVQVGTDRAVIDLGGGMDGIIDLSELAEKGEKSVVKVLSARMPPSAISRMRLECAGVPSEASGS